MEIALALAAAAAFGTADFVGGVASRRSGAFLVALVAQAAGCVVLLPALLALPGVPSQEALWWGALAGIGGGIGLAVFFRALANGVMGLVAPVTGATAAGLPLLAGLALGERPGPLAWAGIVIALGAVVLVGWARNEPGQGGMLASIGMALVAGACFGAFFVCVGRAPHDSGAWPLAAARMGSLGVLAAVLVGAGGEWRAQARTLRLAPLSGVLDMAANVLFLAAVRRGDLAIVAVLASLYPAVTVMLSLGLLGERLRGRQLTGAALALISIALIAIR